MVKIVAALTIIFLCSFNVKSFHHYQSIKPEKCPCAFRSLEIQKLNSEFLGMRQPKKPILARHAKGSMSQERNPLKNTIYFFDDLFHNHDTGKYFSQKEHSENVLQNVVYYLDDLSQNQNLDKYLVHNEENAILKSLRNLVWSVDDMQLNFANQFKEFSSTISVNPVHAIPRQISLYGLIDPATKKGAQSRRTWALAAMRDQMINSTEILQISEQSEDHQTQEVLMDPQPPRDFAGTVSYIKMLEDMHTKAP